MSWQKRSSAQVPCPEGYERQVHQPGKRLSAADVPINLSAFNSTGFVRCVRLGAAFRDDGGELVDAEGVVFWGEPDAPVQLKVVCRPGSAVFLTVAARAEG